MKTKALLLFAGVAAIAMSVTASAQQAPEKMPFDIPYGLPISVENARKVAAAAEAEAKKHDWKMNIAVVGPAGELVYFEKMDGAQLASIQISQDKAVAAATFRRPTKLFFDAVEGGHVYISFLHGVVPSDGGYPLIEGGKLIGAIGCSGGIGSQDGATCKAGAETVK